MSASLILGLVSTIIATSFVSGIFGMAGGLILMGVLLGLLPLPQAMALHAVTQMASNGWRGTLWLAHVRWRAAAMFLTGCTLAFTFWTLWRYVPSKPIAFLLLGLSPFVIWLAPIDRRPDPDKLVHGLLCGSASMALMLLAGVSGPLIDAYFLGGRFDRREIVATKAICQLASHAAKLAYFGGLVGTDGSLDVVVVLAAVFASMAGTSLARPILERLTEPQYRQWATRIITGIATLYLAHASYLLLWR